MKSQLAADIVDGGMARIIGNPPDIPAPCQFLDCPCREPVVPLDHLLLRARAFSACADNARVHPDVLTAQKVPKRGVGYKDEDVGVYVARGTARGMHFWKLRFRLNIGA